MRKFSGLVVLVGLLFWVQSATASLVGIQISDGVNPTITCFDGQACDNTAANDGVVSFDGAIGTWIVNVTTGIGYPALGSPTSLNVDLSSVNVSSAAGGTLSIAFTQDDYVDNGVLSFATHIGGTTNGTLSYLTWIDGANQPFFLASDACSTLIANLGPFSGGAFSGATAGSANTDADSCYFAGGAGYAINALATIVHTGAGATSFDAQTTQVPEASALLLLGTGLLGLGFWGRKRFVK